MTAAGSPRAPRACAFCAIVAGDAPAHVVDRSEVAVAFLDARPLFLGHTLLVPTVHVQTLADLPAAAVEPYFRKAQLLQRGVERATDADGSLVIVNNVVSQSVPHLHLHVIPRRRGDGLRLWLGPRQRYASEAAAAQLAASITAVLPRDRPTGS